jgi:hypothetical protein
VICPENQYTECGLQNLPILLESRETFASISEMLYLHTNYQKNTESGIPYGIIAPACEHIKPGMCWNWQTGMT